MPVNYLAILVSSVITMAIGMFWYSPAGFGKQWMALIGMNQAKLDAAKSKGMNKKYASNFVATLVTAYVLSLFIDLAGATTFIEGAKVGLWAWLGFVATVSLGTILWEDKPAKLYYINNGFNIVTLAIMGGILAVWV